MTTTRALNVPLTFLRVELVAISEDRSYKRGFRLEHIENSNCDQRRRKCTQLVDDRATICGVFSQGLEKFRVGNEGRDGTFPRRDLAESCFVGVIG